MTERESDEAILSQFADRWEVLHPDDVNHPEYVPWTTENEAFTPDQLGALGAWVRISIQPTTRAQTTLGSAPSRKFESRGNVFVQIFAPINAGVGLLADVANDVRETLEGIRLDELLIYAGASQHVPADGVWAMRAVVLPYRYTDTR